MSRNSHVAQAKAASPEVKNVCSFVKFVRECVDLCVGERENSTCEKLEANANT